MSDGIINLGDYIRRREGGSAPASTFSLWGADGERSRFALPLWRAIYLAQGERGGILWEDEADPGVARAFVVLDLASEPARNEFPWPGTPGLDPGRVPEVAILPPGLLCVYLGAHEGRRWFLVVAGGGAGATEPQGRDREDLLFLAGECAGLLFLRDFAADADAD